MSSITISKDTINRLLKDVKQIMKNPLTDNGIYYVHDDEDILKGYAMIVGTSDTPYFSGFYLFKFNFTADYPYSPPVLTFCTNDGYIRFNPNLYINGKVCVSILNTWRGEPWSSCQSITTILLTLCTLLSKTPLINEPGVKISNPDCEIYNSIIEYNNIKVAICNMIEKKQGVLMQEFYVFHSFMKEHFLKNHDALLSFLEQKKKEHPEPYSLKISLYNLTSTIHYSKLLTQFQQCKELCDKIN